MNIETLIQQVRDNLQFLLVCVLVVAAIVAAAKIAEKTILKDTVIRISRTKYITVCGMLGALAAILHIFPGAGGRCDHRAGKDPAEAGD